MSSSDQVTSVEPITPPKSASSRRALLLGALGGLGAWAAGAIGRPAVTRAGVDGDVVLGASNSSASTTTINTSGGFNDAFSAISDTGNAIYASSNSGTAINGNSTSGTGVNGFSPSGSGVYGTSYSFSGVFGYTPGGANTRGVTGVAYGDGTGVVGSSSTAPFSASAPAKTGVYGYATQADGRGVTGQSPAGIGVYGVSSSGYAGYFGGKVFTTQFYELSEIATPAAPAANRARLFVKDNGAGKTQLCVRFHTGAVKVLATEP